MTAARWRLRLAKHLRRPRVFLSVIALAAVVAGALLGPLYPIDPLEQDLMATLKPPMFASGGVTHVAGTDQLGRDVLARLLAGARVSLALGATALAIAMTLGVVLGVLAGFLGGVVDAVITAITETLMALPFVLSVAAYVELAEAAIADVLARGRSPLVVGGTGFYLRALREGLPTVPPADPAAQAPLWEAVAAGRLAELDAELRAAAPADAARAALNARRVVRSLEVLRATGRAPSAFPRRAPRFAYRAAHLHPPLSVLRPRIVARTAAMFERGLVAEVTGLLARYPHQPTALQAIGYKEVVALVRGEATEGEARAAVAASTVRYAKRQRTWFGAEAPEARLASTGEEAFEALAAWLGAGQV